jgi:hypothetical protein
MDEPTPHYDKHGKYVGHIKHCANSSTNSNKNRGKETGYDENYLY